MGFTRDDAALALQLGWTQKEIQATNNSIRPDGYAIVKVFDWGALIGAWGCDGILIVYKGKELRPHSDGLAVCYTDGSGTTAKKPSGIGVYIEEGAKKTLIAENIGPGTNNYAELCAIWRALREFSGVEKELLIRSDSEYAIGILTNLEWHANANADLVRRIRQDLSLRKRVTIEHVKGHEGTEGNEIADGLAGIGRTRVKTPTPY